MLGIYCLDDIIGYYNLFLWQPLRLCHITVNTLCPLFMYCYINSTIHQGGFPPGSKGDTPYLIGGLLSLTAQPPHC